MPSPGGRATRKSHPGKRNASTPPNPPARNDDGLPIAPMTWAERLRRVFLIDITSCPECGGRLRFLADVTEPSAIRKILRHVRSRAPPESLPASRTPPTGTPSAERKTERSFTRTG